MIRSMFPSSQSEIIIWNSSLCFYVCSADSFIRIHPSKLPQGVALDLFRIVLNLCSIGSCLCLIAGTDSGIPAHFQPAFFPCIFLLFCCLYDSHFFPCFFPFPVFSRVCTTCQQHTLPHSALYIQPNFTFCLVFYRYTFANSGEKVLTFKPQIFFHSSSLNSLSSCIHFKRNSAILYRTSFAPPSIISPLFPSAI